MNGKECRLERIIKKTPDGGTHDGRIPVRVNKAMGVDAILGKAERKMLAAIRKEVTGSQHDPDGDVDDVHDADVIDGEVVSSELTPAAEKAAVDTAQAAHEGSQETVAGGEESQAGPSDDKYLSELALNMEGALQVATITDEQNIAIKQEIIDQFTGGNLQQFEAEHLQRLVCENKVRLSKQ
jgi:hypothetical protein